MDDEPDLGETKHNSEGTLVLELSNPSQLEEISSKDTLTIEEASEELELYQTIETLNQETEKLIQKKYSKQCPLLYSCSRNYTDANCLGDLTKFSGCHTFMKKAITAPPKGIDYNSNVLTQLKKIKLNYQNLKQNCINKKIEIENTEKNYQMSLAQVKKFEKEYGISF